MKTKFETTTATLPAYWASYLINGDASGMEDGEQSEADSYLDGIAREGWDIVDCGEESEFRHSNDAGTLAGDCLDYTLMRSIPAARKGSLEYLAWKLMDGAGIELGDRVKVIAYGMTHDGQGWSVNELFVISSDTSALSALEDVRGRFEVFRANYSPRATISSLADITEEDGTLELEIDQIPFLRIEKLEEIPA